MIKYEMLYAGICHTDVHIAAGDMGAKKYPMVPGHELLGKVVEVGAKVTKAKVGDIVAVGCIVDSCLDCQWCASDDEQMCAKGMTMTYGSERKHPNIGGNSSLPTYGGYSGSHVCHERFIVVIPPDMDLEKTAPILCAGITMYEPLRHWGFLGDCTGKTVGIVGVGGLGTMGIKIAKAQGHQVVAISRGPAKAELAKSKGADHHVDSLNKESVEGSPKCDIILNTVSANHDLNVYMPLLAKNGNLV